MSLVSLVSADPSLFAALYLWENIIAFLGGWVFTVLVVATLTRDSSAVHFLHTACDEGH